MEGVDFQGVFRHHVAIHIAWRQTNRYSWYSWAFQAEWNIPQHFWNILEPKAWFGIVYVIVFSYVCDKFGTPDMEGLFLCLSQVRTFGVRKRKYHGPCTLWCHQMWHAGKYPNSSPKFSSSKMEDIQNIQWCLPSGVIKILVLRWFSQPNLHGATPREIDGP